MFYGFDLWADTAVELRGAAACNVQREFIGGSDARDLVCSKQVIFHTTHPKDDDSPSKAGLISESTYGFKERLPQFILTGLGFEAWIFIEFIELFENAGERFHC